jgi:Tfp pilus assembly protein PilN
MKKIIIDLNPTKPEEESPAIKALNKYMPLVIILLLLVIMANIFIFAVVNVFEISYKSLAKTLKTLSSQSQDVQSSRDIMANLAKEKKEYEQIATKNDSLANLMAETATLIPDTLWLTNFSFNNDALTLEGSALRSEQDSMIALNKFIQDLAKSSAFTERFKNIGLKNYRKTKKFNIETMDFRIECVK